jgi:hypothetical protein
VYSMLDHGGDPHDDTIGHGSDWSDVEACLTDDPQQALRQMRAAVRVIRATAIDAALDGGL